MVIRRYSSMAYSSFTATQRKFEQVFEGELPLEPGEVATLQSIVAGERPVLDAMRAARGKRRADWKVRLRSPAYAVTLSHLNGARGAANITRMAVLYEHTSGDDASAVQRLRDLSAESA